MLKGAMDELAVGDPAKLATDVGPVIDAEAQGALLAHIDTMRGRAKSHYQAKLADGARGTMVAPTMFEIDGIGELSREVFGPFCTSCAIPSASCRASWRTSTRPAMA